MHIQIQFIWLVGSWMNEKEDEEEQEVESEGNA